MQIEAGKFYTTRDGRKIGPLGNTFDNEHWPFKCGGYYFKANGYSCPGSLHNHRDADDLIAEWADRKPKVGDRVVILPGAIGTARDHIGEIVEIGAVDERRGGWTVLRFNDGCPLVSGEWEFAPEFEAGDRVVLIKDNCRAEWGAAGEYGTIVRASGRDLLINFDQSGEWYSHSSRLKLAPATNPDATSVPGDIVEVVADRYDAVPVGSLGRVTGNVTAGRHVRMCDDGLSYVFALDEIAKTDEQPEYEYAAGDAQSAADDWNADEPVDGHESDLRDDFAIAALSGLVAYPGRQGESNTPADFARYAYALADAMIAARAA